MTNKHVGRQTLAHAEKAKVILSDQYGSRKHHKSINVVLKKVLLNNILQQRKRVGAIGTNNAKGYYDSIVHSIAILVLI